MRAIASEVPLIYADSRCRNRTRVDVFLSVGISILLVFRLTKSVL